MSDFPSRNVFCTITILVFLCCVLPAGAQTFTVLHNFTGAQDGASPMPGVVDAAGNFYGTAGGGERGPNCQVRQCGLVFKLSQKNSQWTLTPIYNFTGGTDAWGPNPGPIFGPDGALYGTTMYGGSAGAGTVYKLQPPSSPCTGILCYWHETILHSFLGGANDGAVPSGGVTFDIAGNMYGPTSGGGDSGYCNRGCGTVYKLTNSNGQWNESLLQIFDGGAYGGEPDGAVALDNSGNIYGAEDLGGYYGGVYELGPSGSGYTNTLLYGFDHLDQGAYPNGVLYYAGNLYGTTLVGGYYNGGILYELSPGNGGWTLTKIESYSGTGDPPFSVQSSMVADAQGNLYGTVVSGGQYGDGSVFKLTPSANGWVYTSLHDFSGGDGGAPEGVVMDSHGNLFGTTWGGGQYSAGVAFEITP